MQPAKLRPLTRPIVFDQSSLLGKVQRGRVLAFCLVPSGLGVQLRLFAGCTRLPQPTSPKAATKSWPAASARLCWLGSSGSPFSDPGTGTDKGTVARELELGATGFSSPRTRSPHDEAGAPCTRLRALKASRSLTRTLSQAACSTSASRQQQRRHR